MEDTGIGALIIILCNVPLAAVVVGTTWAAATGRIHNNGMVGIRTAATMRSEAAWLAGHRAAWPLARAAGIGIVALTAVAVVLLVLGLPLAALATGFAGILVVLAAAIPIARRASAAAAAVED